MEPIIVEAINKSEESKKIYKDIYDNVIKICIYSIENGNYPSAYELYKNSILNLEEFAKPVIQEKLVRTLKSRLIQNYN